MLVWTELLNEQNDKLRPGSYTHYKVDRPTYFAIARCAAASALS